MDAQNKFFYINIAPKNNYGIIGQICENKCDELSESELLSIIKGPIAAVEGELDNKNNKPFYEYRTRYTNN